VTKQLQFFFVYFWSVLTVKFCFAAGRSWPRTAIAAFTWFETKYEPPPMTFCFLV
jgi:hypothetical protein